MSLSIFCPPPPHWSHLELSPLQQRQIQLTSKPLPLSKIIAQPLNAWLATFQLGISAPLSQQNSENMYIFWHLHNNSHPGRLASRHLVSSSFIWRRLCNNITNRVRSCLQCQQGKTRHHTPLLPQPIPIPQWQFAHLRINLVGPLQYSNG
jgi:hypothetical protein